MDTEFKLSRANPAAPVRGASRRPAAASPHRLSLSDAPPPAAANARSTDPYNTSGSFDRTKNWARVGKR